MGCGGAGIAGQRRVRPAAGAFLALAALLAGSPSARAQNLVERDGTIGPPCADDACILDDDLGVDVWTIPATLGAYSSETKTNLFHSFTTFDIGEGFTARFTRDATDPEQPVPDNLIVRVTGGSGSRIAGILDTKGTDPDAPLFPGTDLFVLNPWGIAFTPDSSLNLAGSLYASTADVLRFPDTDLPTGAATPDPVLSDLRPEEFGFLVSEPAPIPLNRTGASLLTGVPAGETFALVGGDVTLLGNTVRMQGATVALASVASAGVDVPVDVASFDARSLAVDALGEIVVGEGVRIDVRGTSSTGAGRVVVRGGRFEMMPGSRILASNRDLPAWRDPDDGTVLPAVDVEVAGRTAGDAIEGVRMSGSIIADSLGDSPAGDVTIAGPRVELSGESSMIETQARYADGADVILDGAEIVLTAPQGGIESRIRTGTVPPPPEPIYAGTIRIGSDEETESVLIAGGFHVESRNDSDAGVGADVIVRGETIGIQGGARIDSSAGGDATGGRIDVSGGSLTVDASQLSSRAEDAGLGGDVIVRGETIGIQGGALIDSSAGGDATGGRIDVSGGSLTVAESQLRSRAEDAGTGGDVIVAVDTLGVSGAVGGILSLTSDSARGGALDVTASGSDGVAVSALGGIRSLVLDGTEASARAGDVVVRADRVSVVGADTDADLASQIAAVSVDDPDVAGVPGGAGGSLTLQADQVELVDGGQLRTSTAGSGDAGGLLLEGRAPGTAAESLLVTGQSTSAALGPVPSGVFALTTGTGNAGSIEVAARSVEVSAGGRVAASSENLGRGGSVTIREAQSVVVRGGPGSITEIAAQSAAGECGASCPRIDITTGTLEVSGGGLITVSTIGTADAGGITVNADEVTVGARDDPTVSGIFAKTVTGADNAGDSGSIVMNLTGGLTIRDEGEVSVQSVGEGLAGDIEIRGARVVQLDSGGKLIAQVDDTRLLDPGEDGRADIRIQDVDRVAVGPGSVINAESIGSGDAGSVVIGSDDAPVGELVVAGGRISSATRDTGAGGDVALWAHRQVILRDGARVTAESTGAADAGSIRIDAGRRFLAVRNSPLPGEGVVTTRATQASGGTIQIRASELVYLSDSRIETLVERSGDAGDGGDFGTPQLLGSDQDATPAELVVLNRSRVVASAFDGDGGNILIDGTFLPSEALLTDEDLAGLRDSVLDATSETGIPGRVVVTSPGSELAGQLVPLPSNYLDASKLLLTPCAARTARTGSFTVELEAVEPPPDAPFAAGGPPDHAAGAGPESCPSEETP